MDLKAKVIKKACYIFNLIQVLSSSRNKCLLDHSVKGPLNLVDLVCLDHGISLFNLLSAKCFVVEVALMFVSVAVNPTEQTSTAAGEASKAYLLVTDQTPVLPLLCSLDV